MAEVVLGIGSSRSPMTALPPEMWPALGERDKLSTRIKDRFGVPTNYEALLEKAPASVLDHLTPEVMRAKHDAVKRHVQTLVDTIAEVKPDVVIMMGDDEDENIKGDNRPAILVYYGDSYHLIPRATPPGADEMARLSAAAWGDEEGDRATHAAMGLHLVQRLIEAEFDVASARRAEGGRGHGPRLRLHAGPDDARHVGPLRAHHPQRAHAAQPADAQADVRLRPRRAGRRSRMARR